MDSPLLHLNTITKRMIKNARFTPIISKMLRKIAVRFLRHPLSILFSASCQGDGSKLKQATTIMASPNSFEIPQPCSFSSRTMSIMSTLSKRLSVIRNDNLETVSLFSFESLAVFTKSSRMGGVRQRAVFKVMGPKNLSLSRLSPTKPSTMAMLGTIFQI